MTPVDSSAFSHVDHDARAKVLTVRFHSGKTYRYAGVDKPMFDELMGASSMGSHFATRIKPHHAATPV